MCSYWQELVLNGRLGLAMALICLRYLPRNGFGLSAILGAVA